MRSSRNLWKERRQRKGNRTDKATLGFHEYNTLKHKLIVSQRDLFSVLVDWEYNTPSDTHIHTTGLAEELVQANILRSGSQKMKIFIVIILSFWGWSRFQMCLMDFASKVVCPQSSSPHVSPPCKREPLSVLTTSFLLTDSLRKCNFFFISQRVFFLSTVHKTQKPSLLYFLPHNHHLLTHTDT